MRLLPPMGQVSSVPCLSSVGSQGDVAGVGCPFVAMNHLEAHLYAAFLEEPDLEMPLVILLVSGGHTMLIVMEDHLRYRVLLNLDGAAGEASTRSLARDPAIPVAP